MDYLSIHFSFLFPTFQVTLLSSFLTKSESLRRIRTHFRKPRGSHHYGHFWGETRFLQPYWLPNHQGYPRRIWKWGHHTFKEGFQTSSEFVKLVKLIVRTKKLFKICIRCSNLFIFGSFWDEVIRAWVQSVLATDKPPYFLVAKFCPRIQTQSAIFIRYDKNSTELTIKK